MLRQIRAVIFLPIAVLSYILFGSVAIISSFITGNGDFAHRLGRIWSRVLFSAAGARLTVSGLENIPRGRPVVFASNHASQFDIPALYLALNVQFRFLVKKELFRIPLFGTAMLKAGYIPIDRSGGRAAVLSIRKAAEKIRSGTSVVVFPEGTRSVDGRLGPFKPGGMQLAIQAGCPIVPVAISGSYKVLPKGSLKVRPGSIKVAVGRSMDPGGTRDEMIKKVWSAILDMLDSDNRPIF